MDTFAKRHLHVEREVADTIGEAEEDFGVGFVTAGNEATLAMARPRGDAEQQQQQMALAFGFVTSAQDWLATLGFPSRPPL